MVKVALYIRVSKEEQAKGYSIEGQLDSTRKYAEERGWEVVEEYIDPGFSARTDERPAFKRMIADAKLGKFEVVMVLKGDRFARNRAHASMYKQLLKGIGIKVVSVMEPVEEGTPAGIILEGMNEVIAEWYSVDLSVKVTDAKRRRAKKGLWNGLVPFGYKAIDSQNLEVVADEAELVSQTYQRYATGRFTDESIAVWLNQTSFRPRVHRRDRKEKEAIWSKDTVGGMLTNAFYLGYTKYKGDLFPGKHQPIINEELFESVKTVRQEHRRGPSTFSRRSRTYLFSGLLRNIHCGEKLTAHHISKHDYYQDTCSKRGLPCSQSKKYVRGDILEAQVSDLISNLVLPTSWRELVLEMLSSKEEIEASLREKSRLEEKLRRLRNQYREVEIDEDEYKRELGLTKAKLSSLVVPEHEELIGLGDHIEGMVVAWIRATQEERRDLLRLMVESIYVDLDNSTILGLQPRPGFLPLFNMKEPVMAGETMLATKLTGEGFDSGRGRHCNTSKGLLKLDSSLRVVLCVLHSFRETIFFASRSGQKLVIQKWFCNTFRQCETEF